MRGTFAAACAAVLMGVAPPPALACSSLCAAACASEQDAVYVIQRVDAALYARGSAAPTTDTTGRNQADALPRSERPVAWRAPSGPAPSQAPPARA